MSVQLEIRDLFGGYENGVNILQGIKMLVSKGEAVGIIGLNGSGKSTLGKAIMNLIPHRSGEIIYEGQHVENLDTHELVRLGIALMQQGGVVFPTLSVWQNLQLAMCDVKTQDFVFLQTIIPLLQQPRTKLMQTMADRLSGGQRHELALAMTLAHKPKLVILDEPSAGLSPKAVEQMYEILGEVRRRYGTTIVLIEQNIHHAIKFCDRCMMVTLGVVSGEFVSADAHEIEKAMFESEKM